MILNQCNSEESIENQSDIYLELNVGVIKQISMDYIQTNIDKQLHKYDYQSSQTELKSHQNPQQSLNLDSKSQKIELGNLEIDQLSQEKIDQKSQEKIDQLSSKEIDQKSLEKIDQLSSKEIDQKSFEKINQISTEKINQISTKKINQISSQEIDQISSENLEQSKDHHLATQEQCKNKRHTISSKKYNQVDQSSIFRYIYDEAKKDVLIFLTIYSVFLIFKDNLEFNCQIEFKDIVNYCTDDIFKYQFLKQLIVEKVGQSIQALYFIQGFLKIKQQEYLVILLVYLSLKIWLEVLVIPVILIYGCFKKVQLKIKNIQFLRYFTLISSLFIIQNVWAQVFRFDRIQLEINQQLLFSNFLCGIARMIYMQIFKYKLEQLEFKEFHEIKFGIMIIYFIENSLVFSQLMKTDDIRVLTQIYLSQIVTTIYYLTQFHLWLFLFRKMIIIIWTVIFQNRCLWLKERILNLVKIIWIDMQQYIKKIKLFDEQEIKQDDSKMTQKLAMEYDIQRVFASYFLIAQLHQYIYLIIVLFFKIHIPYLMQTQILTYHKENIEIKDSQINFELYRISWIKLIIHISLFTISFMGVYYYGTFKKFKFFGMKTLTVGQSLISNLFIILYLSVIISFCFI